MEANSLNAQTVYSFITTIARILNLSYSHSYKTLHTEYLEWGKLVSHGLDAAAWKCLRNSFKTASVDVCDTLAAATARWICTCYLVHRSLSAFVVSYFR